MRIGPVELDPEGTWEASLEVQDSHPFRCYRDTGHRLAAQRAYPSGALLRPEIPYRGMLILRATSSSSSTLECPRTSRTLYGQALSSMVSATLGLAASTLSLGALGGDPRTN